MYMIHQHQIDITYPDGLNYLLWSATAFFLVMAFAVIMYMLLGMVNSIWRAVLDWRRDRLIIQQHNQVARSINDRIIKPKN